MWTLVLTAGAFSVPACRRTEKRKGLDGGPRGNLFLGPTINPFPTCSLATSQLVASENMSPKITSNLLKHLTPDMNMKEKQTSGVVFPTGMEVPSGSCSRAYGWSHFYFFTFGPAIRHAKNMIDQPRALSLIFSFLFPFGKEKEKQKIRAGAWVDHWKGSRKGNGRARQYLRCAISLSTSFPGIVEQWPEGKKTVLATCSTYSPLPVFCFLWATKGKGPQKEKTVKRKKSLQL